MSVASRSSKIIEISAKALLFFAALLTVGSIYFTAHYLVGMFGNSVHSRFHWYIGITLAFAMSAWEFAVGSNFFSPSFWPFLFEIPQVLEAKGRKAQSVSSTVTGGIMLLMALTTIGVYTFDFYTTYHGLGIDNHLAAIFITALQVVFPELCVTMHGITRWNAKISRKAERDMDRQLDTLAAQVADEDRQYMKNKARKRRKENLRLANRDRRNKRKQKVRSSDRPSDKQNERTEDRNGRGELSERESLR